MDKAKYIQYAEDVRSGKIITCQYIKLAVERFYDFMTKYEFKPDRVERVINFISKLRHYTGASSGKYFVLESWQEFIIANIFGFYSNGHRVTKNVYVEVARKNGKSALMSAIALYCMIADGEDGAEIDIIANSREQAKILFKMAKNFSETIDRKGKYLDAFRDRIDFEKTKSFIKAHSSDYATLDGYNASCFIFDELHASKSSELYDVFKSSQGMRQNPLAICITTAGYNLFGFCFKMRETCIEILKGLKKDDSQFTMIYTLDEDDDWQDEKNWVKANPNMDVTIRKDYLKEQVQSAKNNTSLEVSVKTKNFNVWCSSEETWIENSIIQDASDNLDFEDFRNQECWIGVDLASVSDFTAISFMFNKDEKYYFITKYYIPHDTLYSSPNTEIYKQWKRNKQINITAGNVTDYDVILSDILKIQSQYGIFYSKIGYDQYNSTQWAVSATEQGLPLMPYSQALWNFNRPTKEFERLIKSNKVVIDNNEITRWCFDNVMLKRDHNENIKPVKGGSDNLKIDGVISMVESLGVYLSEPRFNNQVDVIL